MEISIVAIVIAFFAIVIASKGITIVPQANIYVVERLGKFHKELHGGFHIIIPVIDTIRNKLTIQEQIIDIDKQHVITRDNVVISIDGIVFVKIIDGKEATYNVVNVNNAISNLAMTTLRSEIGQLPLDDTLSSREQLNGRLLTELDRATVNWGVKIMRVEIADISVPREIEQSMQAQLKAERDKRAIELTAQANKEATIREAEGQKQKTVLEAEAIERMADAKKYEEIALAQGQKQAIEMINEAMENNSKAAEFLLAKDRISAFSGIANSNSQNKIVIPYETADVLGSLSVITEFLKDKPKG
ncbi:MAG: SPFH domain-containing protein [Arcobacteraceae bacterium]|jgi:regulator of protease activity HflC (stomatin/prohibitin superfamily)|nr:SPFH domain-containing protein [Arcobacteraceae bacterium]